MYSLTVVRVYIAMFICCTYPPLKYNNYALHPEPHHQKHTSADPASVDSV